MTRRVSRHDEIDVEGLPGFAGYVITNAARLWVEASGEQRPAFSERSALKGCVSGTEELVPS